MEYRHINDCWNELDKCETIEQVYDVIDTFPRWSGDWDVRFEDDEVVVINDYFDRDSDSCETDERVLDNIKVPHDWTVLKECLNNEVSYFTD